MAHLNAPAYCFGAFSNAFPKTTFQIHDLAVRFSEIVILFNKLIVLGSSTNRGSNIQYLFVIHHGSISMKPLLCVLTQFLKMGGLDYKRSQEIMLARLEVRGCDSLGEPY